MDYEEERLTEISQFISDIKVKVEDLQHLQNSTSSLLRHSHPTDIIQNGDGMRSKLQHAINVEIPDKYTSLDKERCLYNQGKCYIHPYYFQQYDSSLLPI